MVQPTSFVGELKPQDRTRLGLIRIQLRITAYVWEALQTVQLQGIHPRATFHKTVRSIGHGTYTLENIQLWCKVHLIYIKSNVASQCWNKSSQKTLLS